MRDRDDGDWLEFTAELLREPLTELPLDRVTVMLRETFGAAAVAAAELGRDGSSDGEIYPLDAALEGYREDMKDWGRLHGGDNPIARYFRATADVRPIQIADIPARFADGHVYGEGAALSKACGVPEQLCIPAGTQGARMLVVGRPEVFSADDLRLADRVWCVLSGLDRQARAYAAALRNASPSGRDVARSIRLTPRERAVLGLLAEGLTAGAIARRLDIAERTVHKHLERCYSKLGVADRLTAVLAAQRLGLVAA
ncbi:LuxR C-terminal-related transcriptional regulator [Pseudonocardia kujensis]|uniref:helix-turn-helix transcriptional regulator n=1 Tax=Pseudonocardia kujensis TaxID=1128675 RepID=UPI001E512C30|nr:LuxR C-terminal-related transcriptional regulator [Pseudonocardia kujensis]MCE0765264.1 LuxR C-terminal-related transcriptional regulator [Pseudonocardia kujensis]